jgi:hypothetical protein
MLSPGNKMAVVFVIARDGTRRIADIVSRVPQILDRGTAA